MTSVLILEPVGGIAGDMFLAAAVDLGVDRPALEAMLSSLPVGRFRLELTRRADSGIEGTHVEVVSEEEPPHARGLQEILELIGKSQLSPRAKTAARALFGRIGRAEAKVHGVPLEAVHFHEVGAVDSIVDLCGAAVVLDLLGWPKVFSAPPELGRGIVRTAHGPLPIPAPAVLELLTGKPVRPGGPQGEAVTPTGAAILAELCEVGPLPEFTPARIGYGLGTRTWPDRPNVLRMTLGESTAVKGMGEEPLFVLEANLDDCTGELLGRAIEAALEAGAVDAWAAPLTMKKGRPGVLLGALCFEGSLAAVTEAYFKETSTLGVRRHPVEREALDRRVEEVETPYGKVRVKVALLHGREVGAHPEYEDCAARAREHGLAVRQVMSAALLARGPR